MKCLSCVSLDHSVLGADWSEWLSNGKNYILAPRRGNQPAMNKKFGPVGNQWTKWATHYRGELLGRPHWFLFLTSSPQKLIHGWNCSIFPRKLVICHHFTANKRNFQLKKISSPDKGLAELPSCWGLVATAGIYPEVSTGLQELQFVCLRQAARQLRG